MKKVSGPQNHRNASSWESIDLWAGSHDVRVAFVGEYGSELIHTIIPRGARSYRIVMKVHEGFTVKQVKAIIPANHEGVATLSFNLDYGPWALNPGDTMTIEFV